MAHLPLIFVDKFSPIELELLAGLRFIALDRGVSSYRRSQGMNKFLERLV